MTDEAFFDLTIPAVRLLQRPRMTLADGTQLVFTAEPMFDVMALYLAMSTTNTTTKASDARVEAATTMLRRSIEEEHRPELQVAIDNPASSGLSAPGLIGLASRLMTYYLGMDGAGDGPFDSASSSTSDETTPSGASGAKKRGSKRASSASKKASGSTGD